MTHHNYFMLLEERETRNFTNGISSLNVWQNYHEESDLYIKVLAIALLLDLLLFHLEKPRQLAQRSSIC